jgi:hypothetical protein
VLTVPWGFDGGDDDGIVDVGEKWRKNKKRRMSVAKTRSAS